MHSDGTMYYALDSTRVAMRKRYIIYRDITSQLIYIGNKCNFILENYSIHWLYYHCMISLSMIIKIVGTCNAESSLFANWFLGHLNFQIEHQ